VRLFVLRRHVDVSGVSGTGEVAFGVELPSGKAVLEWISASPSIAIYESAADVIRIHGHGGATELVYLHSGFPPVRLGEIPIALGAGA
jgi:hypothetical protein